jgi:hypothetical protein
LIKEVVIDRKEVEFLVTDAGVLVIEATELPQDEGVYDITLYYDEEEIFLESAFSVLYSRVPLKIDSVASIQNSTSGNGIEIKGAGFVGVQKVLVNGYPSEFVGVSDTVLHALNQVLSRTKTIELVSENEKVTYTP